MRTLNQSLSEVMQNQSNLLITFDTQLKTTLNKKVLPVSPFLKVFRMENYRPQISWKKVPKSGRTTTVTIKMTCPLKSSWFLLQLGCIRADLHDTILSHARSSRQAYDMTYDCRSVLKHVLKCYDIFSDVHNNRKSCRGPVISRCRMRQSRTV